MSFCVPEREKEREEEKKMIQAKKERQGKAEVSGDRDCLANYSLDRRKPDKGTKEVKKMPECFRRDSATGTINSVLTLLFKRCAGEFFFARARVLMNAAKDCITPPRSKGEKERGIFFIEVAVNTFEVVQIVMYYQSV